MALLDFRTSAELTVRRSTDWAIREHDHKL